MALELLNDCGARIVLFKGIEAEFDPFTEIDTFQLKQEQIKLFGKLIDQPRLCSFYGDSGINYTYSKRTFTALNWNDFLIKLKARIEDRFGLQFNSALVNLYRDGMDSMGIHSDDEKELGKNPTIVSVSYGSERIMHFVNKSNKRKLHVKLRHGDVLLMEGTVQHLWKHELKKEPKVTEQRLNVTFREIKSL